MRVSLQKLLQLAIVLSPAVCGLLLTQLIPPWSDKNLGVGLGGVVGTAATIILGFVTEMYGKYRHKGDRFTLVTTSIIAGLFVILLVFEFLLTRN